MSAAAYDSAMVLPVAENFALRANAPVYVLIDVIVHCDDGVFILRCARNAHVAPTLQVTSFGWMSFSTATAAAILHAAHVISFKSARLCAETASSVDNFALRAKCTRRSDLINVIVHCDDAG